MRWRAINYFHYLTTSRFAPRANLPPYTPISYSAAIAISMPAIIIDAATTTPPPPTHRHHRLALFIADSKLYALYDEAGDAMTRDMAEDAHFILRLHE